MGDHEVDHGGDHGVATHLIFPQVLDFELVNMLGCLQVQEVRSYEIIKNKRNQKHFKKFLQAEAELLGDHEGDHDFKN